jgi:hypothetical protein
MAGYALRYLRDASIEAPSLAKRAYTCAKFSATWSYANLGEHLCGLVFVAASDAAEFAHKAARVFAATPGVCVTTLDARTVNVTYTPEFVFAVAVRMLDSLHERPSGFWFAGFMARLERSCSVIPRVFIQFSGPKAAKISASRAVQRLARQEGFCCHNDATLDWGFVTFAAGDA